MKKQLLFYTVLVSLTLSLFSCKKEDISTNDFDVTLINNPTKVGDTAFFSIEGNPDFITFYSGEKGRNIDYRSRLSADSSIPQISFTSFGQSLSTQFPNSISLLISSNYNGDSLSINSATWADITNRAIFSTGTTSTASGTISLADFRNLDTVYVAFRYKVGTSASATQPTWTIQSFNYNNISLPDSNTHAIRTIATTGWQTKDIANAANGWVISSSQLRMAGGAINANPTEDWVITKLSLKAVTSDLGIPIKNISERVKTYSYRFNKAGVYEVAFLASSKRIDSNKETIKKIKIIIN